jgi:hypothetical protein
MLQEIRTSPILESFKRGEPLNTLRFEANEYSISGIPGNEIIAELVDHSDGIYSVKVIQKGVPQLGSSEFFLVQPAITYSNGVIKLRDTLENIVTFSPILD